MYLCDHSKGNKDSTYMELAVCRARQLEILSVPVKVSRQPLNRRVSPDTRMVPSRSIPRTAIEGAQVDVDAVNTGATAIAQNVKVKSAADRFENLRPSSKTAAFDVAIRRGQVGVNGVQVGAERPDALSISSRLACPKDNSKESKTVTFNTAIEGTQGGADGMNAGGALRQTLSFKTREPADLEVEVQSSEQEDR
jgi:hypothetical protein